MDDPLPPARPISLLVCDNVHTDPYTFRKTLLGLFDEFVAAEYPAVIPVCHFYAEVTEVYESTAFRVRVIVADPDAEAIWESEPVYVEPDSPLARSYLAWGVVELSLPESGVYLVQLVDGHERIIHERQLIARQTPEAKHDE